MKHEDLGGQPGDEAIKPQVISPGVKTDAEKLEQLILDLGVFLEAADILEELKVSLN